MTSGRFVQNNLNFTQLNLVVEEEPEDAPDFLFVVGNPESGIVGTFLTTPFSDCHDLKDVLEVKEIETEWRGFYEKRQLRNLVEGDLHLERTQLGSFFENH